MGPGRNTYLKANNSESARIGRPTLQAPCGDGDPRGRVRRLGILSREGRLYKIFLKIKIYIPHEENPSRIGPLERDPHGVARVAEGDGTSVPIPARGPAVREVEHEFYSAQICVEERVAPPSHVLNSNGHRHRDVGDRDLRSHR